MQGYANVGLKELIHLRRDPATLVIALMIPIVQLTLFGYAIDFDVRHISTAVVDMDHSRESRAYIDSLRNTQYVEVTSFENTPVDAEEALRRGSARLAVIIPPDYAQKSGAGKKPTVRVLVDGSDNLVATRARLAFLGPPATDARVDVMFNPNSRSAVFMIPGLIGVILQLVTVALTSFSLVRAREQGTLEQLMVTPVGRLALMLGKLTPYAALAMIEMASVLLIGWLVFDVSVAGSTALLLLLSLPFVVAALSLGLLISTIAQNQAQALQLTLLITLPSILMSGFVFPRETMPGALFLLSDIIPVTFFLQILRAIIVRGAGFTDVWPSVLALIAITVVLLSAALSRFHKQTG
jgi:ABC-type multidrug transport system permease subunit